MKFEAAFLDDLRARLKVSAVVGRRYELTKRGTEYVAKDDPSISVNDQKGIWFDFGAAQKGGDIFDFVMHDEGVDFVEAVKRCAEQAGVRVADHEGGDQGGKDRSGAADRVQKTAKGSSRRHLVATYDYTDAHGRLIYQVCRFNLVNEAGEKTGKTFGQRRPAPDEPGVWVWALDSGEFMRRKDGEDWYRYDERRYAEKGYKQHKQIDGGVEHGLFNLPAMLDAVDDGEVIFLPEGEKDCQTFDRWDLCATTNSGGAKNWSDRHALQLTGADVVIPIDNDEAGRDRGHKIAASLKGKAKRVRILDLKQFWSEMPDKADVTDWKEKGGTREQLLEIIERIGDWQPAPPRSSFGAVRFIDLDTPAREHEWLIKGILPRGERSILAGVPGSGKSFAAIDMCFSIARAALDPSHRFQGRTTRGGLVLYQAGEGGTGVRKRMRAYRQYNGIPAGLDLPFVLMPGELNLFANEEAVKRFIEEGRAWSAFYEMPVEIASIDTFSAATTGANENMAEDMTKALNRAKMISDGLNCHVQLVHHWNKAGSLRGWSGLHGNVDAVIEVMMLEDFETGEDGVSRQIRAARVTKQKDGEGSFAWKFTLPQVVIGKDPEGDPITSCIVRPLGEMDAPVVQAVRGKNVGVMLSEKRVGVFSTLLKAIEEVGMPPPAELQLPASITKVVKVGQHFAYYNKRVARDEETAKKHEKTIRTRLREFREWGQNCGIIGVHTIGEKETADSYIWPTGKPVWGHGLQWPPRVVEENDTDGAGEPPEDFWGDEPR
jgi:hypothetical protein